jgi:hypothetical protein
MMKFGNSRILRQFALLCVITALILPSAACKKGVEATESVVVTAHANSQLFKCPRGQNRIEIVKGKEDAFDMSKPEPSDIRPERLPNAYLEALATAQSGVIQLRDYDERGSDKVLIDHFAVPRGIVSGALILSVRYGPGADNDAIILGNMNEGDFADSYNRLDSFHVDEGATPDAATNGETKIITAKLDNFIRNKRSKFTGNLVDYLNSSNRPDAIDFEVNEDTAVDVAILVLCQQPVAERGTSLSEFRTKFISPDVSVLACFMDKTQAPCNPFQGDQLCTASLPMACYKEGQRNPDGLKKAGFPGEMGAGGEVRQSRKVPGNQFATLNDANQFCAAEHGAGWRVLDFHDGASGNIATYSDIAPKTRLWINVRGQRYANCWDRDKPQ